MVQRYETLSRRTIRLSPNSYGANIREISEIGKEIPDFNKSEDYRSPTDFTDEHRFLCGLCGRGYADLALLPAGQWVRRTNLPSAADFQFTDGLLPKLMDSITKH